MLGSLSYIFTTIFLSLTMIGFSRLFIADQAVATMFVAVIASILGLIIALLATKGHVWILKVIFVTSLFSIVHLLSLKFPTPGLLVFCANLFFCYVSYSFLKRVLSRSVNISKKIEKY